MLHGMQVCLPLVLEVVEVETTLTVDTASISLT
jgi:hypothetical protein